MTINERVKHFRKDVLHISQTEFAVSLGMKQTGVSYMERDGSTVTDQTIKAICLLYNVNEEWLRTGSGEMYIQSDAFSLDDFVKSKGATGLELEIIKTYFELDPEIRRTAVEFFKRRLVAAVTADPALLVPDMAFLGELEPQEKKDFLVFMQGIRFAKGMAQKIAPQSV